MRLSENNAVLARALPSVSILFKNAIKREQRRACTGTAEREHFI